MEKLALPAPLARGHHAKSMTGRGESQAAESIARSEPRRANCVPFSSVASFGRRVKEAYLTAGESGANGTCAAA